MNAVDVERTLNGEWQALVENAHADPGLAPAIVEGRGSRTTRPMLWSELQDVRLAFAELQAALDEESKAEALATSAWTVRDVVVHLASWASEFTRQIETAAARQPFDYVITFTPRVGPTDWNARELERRRAMSLADAFGELDAGTERIQALALSLPDEVLFSVAELPQTPDGRLENRWRVPLANLMIMKCWHDHYHLARLREVLDLPQ